MPFTGTTFAYTNPTGATGAAAGQVVQSAVWDQVHTDLSSAITQVFAQEVSMTTFRNFIAPNGSFEVWQRDAGATASISVAAGSTLYTADRWYLSTSATAANELMYVSAVTGLVSQSRLAAKLIRASGQTGVSPVVFSYPLDTPEIVRMRGLKVSFQMLAQTGALWTPANGTFTAILYLGTGAVAKRNATPYTNETQGFAISTNLAAASAVTAISGSSSAIIPITTTQAELQISWTPVGTAGATDSIVFDDVMIEGQNSSGVWTPTNYDRIPFENELTLCKRFFQKSFDYSTAPLAAAGLVNAFSAVAVATQALNFWWDLPVELRVAPGTVTTYNPLQSGTNWESVSLSVDSASVAVNVRTSNAGSKGITIMSTTSGAVTNTVCYIHAVVDAGI